MAPWLAILTLLTVTPFWESSEARDWSEEQLLDFFGNSPWALPAQSSNASDGVLTFLATAKPVQLAEIEQRRRRIKKLPGMDPVADPAWDEYQEFLARDGARYIVLAVAIPIHATMDAAEMANMENESVLRLGKRKIRMSGYFPPSPTDPYTRLIFPREDAATVKELLFELFIPGAGAPYRHVFYTTKKLSYRGKLEM